jgi:valyl-tRNA synthetase
VTLLLTGHDVNDYEIGNRVGLPIINIMNKDGSLNAKAGEYAGLDRFEVCDQMCDS